MKNQMIPAIAAVLFLFASPALADAPVIEDVTVNNTGTSRSISVTISHPDTGWDHYADGWEVLAPDGTRLGFRELVHPHVNEQPFTRSLGGVEIPPDLEFISIRARGNVDGWVDEVYRVDLTN